jgi:hypothetical protein
LIFVHYLYFKLNIIYYDFELKAHSDFIDFFLNFDLSRNKTNIKDSSPIDESLINVVNIEKGPTSYISLCYESIIGVYTDVSEIIVYIKVKFLDSLFHPEIKSSLEIKKMQELHSECMRELQPHFRMREAQPYFRSIQTVKPTFQPIVKLPYHEPKYVFGQYINKLVSENYSQEWKAERARVVNAINDQVREYLIERKRLSGSPKCLYKDRGIEEFEEYLQIDAPEELKAEYIMEQQDNPSVARNMEIQAQENTMANLVNEAYGGNPNLTGDERGQRLDQILMREDQERREALVRVKTFKEAQEKYRPLFRRKEE